MCLPTAPTMANITAVTGFTPPGWNNGKKTG